MIEDKQRQLITRHLLQDATLEGELALLSKQPAKKLATMLERLEALDHYMDLVSPSVEEVDAAAAKLGVSRRQFYRLLTKLRALGPVKALVPGMQNVARASSAREGLAEPIEAALVQALRQEPDAKITKLESMVAAHCARRGLIPPTEWMLRQRVHALRASGTIPRDAVFGARIAVDQINIDLPVLTAGGFVKFGTVTAIIDRSTRLILGASISVEGWHTGLSLAIDDMRRKRITQFANERFPIAVRVSELTWVVPPRLEDFASAATELFPASTRISDVNVISEGPRRHGELIMRLLGDRLGPYPFRSRNMPGSDPELHGRSGTNFDDALRMIEYCVDAWNKKIVRHLPRVPDSDLPKRGRRLNRVSNEIDAFFGPVMARIEDWFTSRADPYHWILG